MLEVVWMAQSVFFMWCFDRNWATTRRRERRPASSATCEKCATLCAALTLLTSELNSRDSRRSDRRQRPRCPPLCPPLLATPRPRHPTGLLPLLQTRSSLRPARLPLLPRRATLNNNSIFRTCNARLRLSSFRNYWTIIALYVRIFVFLWDDPVYCPLLQWYSTFFCQVSFLCH